jgi:MFS family permease
VVNAYTLALAGGLLVAGRAADLYGQRRLLLAGLLGLTGATVLAAAAPSAELLIVARALQGMSAAMAQPASLALVPTLFHASRSGARPSPSSGLPTASEASAAPWLVAW